MAAGPVRRRFFEQRLDTVAAGSYRESVMKRTTPTITTASPTAGRAAVLARPAYYAFSFYFYFYFYAFTHPTSRRGGT